LAQLKTVHTALWPHCLNNRLNWPYDSPHSLRLGSRLFQTCGPVVANVLSPKLLCDRLTSVGRTQLSDMGVGDERTVVGQVTRGVAGQGPVDESLVTAVNFLANSR